MTNTINNNNFDDITHLIKKTQWPLPSASLCLRIENAVYARAESLMIMQSLWFTRSPLLSGLAVLTALVLGIGSGFVTSGKASANSYSPYAHASPSIAQVYFGQISENNRQ